MDGVTDEDEEYKPRGELVREVEALKQKNRTLREDLQRKDIILNRYEIELKR